MPQTLNTPTDANVITGSYSLCLNDVDLGLTSGGVTISQANTFEDITGDQTLALIGRFVTQRIYTITVNVRDMTLDKMRAYLGQTAAQLNLAGDTLCVVESGDCAKPEEFTLAIKGPGPGCNCRNFYFPRVIITPAQVDILISNTAIAEIAMEFTAIPTTAGAVFCITDTCDQIATDVSTLAALTCNVGVLP